MELLFEVERSSPDASPEPSPRVVKFYNDFLVQPPPAISQFRDQIKTILDRYQPFFTPKQGPSWFKETWEWVKQELETLEEAYKLAEANSYDRPLLDVCRKIASKLETISLKEKLQLTVALAKWNFIPSVQQLLARYLTNRVTINLEPPTKDFGSLQTSYVRLQCNYLLLQRKMKASNPENPPADKSQMFQDRIAYYLREVSLKRQVIEELTAANNDLHMENARLAKRFDETSTLLDASKQRAQALKQQLAKTQAENKKQKDNNQLLNMKLDRLTSEASESRPRQQEELMSNQESSVLSGQDLQEELITALKEMSYLKEELAKLRSKSNCNVMEETEDSEYVQFFKVATANRAIFWQSEAMLRKLARISDNIESPEPSSQR